MHIEQWGVYDVYNSSYRYTHVVHMYTHTHVLK